MIRTDLFFFFLVSGGRMALVLLEIFDLYQFTGFMPFFLVYADKNRILFFWYKLGFVFGVFCYKNQSCDTDSFFWYFAGTSPVFVLLVFVYLFFFFEGFFWVWI